MKRFAIRDLLWLTVVIAILLVWWMDHRNFATSNPFIVDTIRASDGEPIQLLDKEQPGVIYVRDAEGWKTMWTPGHPPAPFKPEQ